MEKQIIVTEFKIRELFWKKIASGTKTMEIRKSDKGIQFYPTKIINNIFFTNEKDTKYLGKREVVGVIILQGRQEIDKFLSVYHKELGMDGWVSKKWVNDYVKDLQEAYVFLLERRIGDGTE